MKRLFLYTAILIGLLFGGTSICFAGGTEGATPFNFLFMDSARAGAIGGAFAAVGGNAETLLYNPAGLSKIGKNQATFGYTKHFENVNQKYLGIVLKQGYGLIINTVNSDNIKRTTISNPTGSGLGEFEITDWLLSIGYGKLYKDGLMGFGIAGKYISESIDNYNAKAIAVDLGVIIYMQDYDLPLNIGLAIQNMGTKAKFQSEREDLPVNIKTGIAWNFLESGLLAVDMNVPKYGKTTFHIGSEYEALKKLILRIGYNGRNETDSGITFGVGFKHEKFSFDYAFIPYGDLGNNHIIGLSFEFE